MSLEYFYEIVVIAPIRATLFNIADHGDENIAAIDKKEILTLSNKEISRKYYDERYHIETFQLCLWSVSTRLRGLDLLL